MKDSSDSDAPKDGSAMDSATPTGCVKDSDCDNGNFCTPGSCNDDGECEFAEPECRRVFITSREYTGDLGGYSGAHEACEAMAEQSGLGNSRWLAWISAGLKMDPVVTFAPTPLLLLPYRQLDPDHTKVADNWNDLVSHSLDSGIAFDETGEAVSPGAPVWTGTNSSGRTGGLKNCLGWTTSSDAEDGDVGFAGSTTAAWTFAGELRSCDQSLRLYCFEQ